MRLRPRPRCAAAAGLWGSGKIGRPGLGEAGAIAGRMGATVADDRRSVLKKMLALGAAAPLAVGGCTQAAGAQSAGDTVRGGTGGRTAGARSARAPSAGARAAGAPSARARAALTPRQLAGQRVIFSYPGLTVPAGPAAADPRGPGGRGDLLRREHLQRSPDRVGDQAVAPGAAAKPGVRAVAADDRPGGRPGPAAARRPGDVGEAGRGVRESGLGGQPGRRRRRAESRWRGHERQSGAGARRLLQVRQLHRSVPALVQPARRRP